MQRRQSRSKRDRVPHLNNLRCFHKAMVVVMDKLFRVASRVGKFSASKANSKLETGP